MNRMLRVVTTLALCLPGTVLASQTATSTVLRLPAGPTENTLVKAFAVDPALQRSWLEVSVIDAVKESFDTHRVRVDGLSYDAEARQVVYEIGNRRWICADVVDRGWGVFRHQQVRPTGQCSLHSEYVERVIDNGFTVEPRQYLEVHLQPVTEPVASTEEGRS